MTTNAPEAAPGTPPGITHPADRLIEGIERASAPVCVGLDPVVERLPLALQPSSTDPRVAADAIGVFSRGVLEAVAGIVPCVKMQSACYERYGAAGVQALEETIVAAERLGLQVILDVKRGDIGISVEHYAAAAFGPSDTDQTEPAWVTASPYLGTEGFTPFLDRGRGVFALVRTSNPSGDAVQELLLADGCTVAEAVGAVVADAGDACIGTRGYSALGAVVGATKTEAAERLRTIMPRQIFLVPGFGAQGGGEDDVKPCFNADGLGAIITASRSVIYAFDAASADWKGDIARSATDLAERLGRLVGLR